MITIGYYSDKMGLKLTDAQSEKFLSYQRLLLDWNERMNLTAITGLEEIALKHFADSVSVYPYISKAFKNKEKVFPDLSMIDVGAGAGFPGIPLKIIFPGLSMTLMDSLGKRISFLDELIHALALEGCTTVHSRAEDGGKNPVYREKFDIAIARAVADMSVLSEYCLPYVKVGGIFVAMKSTINEELDTAENAIRKLGGEIESRNDFLLPDSDMKRSVIIIRKISKTPPIYPRKAGLPEKKPIK